ncbi:unnamed protein product [Phytophthora fragariaefolia]|uniref:Unnamed protein product n=1 Tax=Phytophthora fragariaefolia TaxID=1490495 RepID=A0A9W6Y5K2_9STRA|nr:unnamed protein product [Phytophthora fragariaefolia]
MVNRQLHNLLSTSIAADGSTETQLRRQLSPPCMRQTRGDGPDTPVWVTEGEFSTCRHLYHLGCLSAHLSRLYTGLCSGEVDWDLLALSDETQVVVRDALDAADSSRSADEIADNVARAAFLVSALPSEMSPNEQTAEPRHTSPGTSLAAVQ